MPPPLHCVYNTSNISAIHQSIHAPFQLGNPSPLSRVVSRMSKCGVDGYKRLFLTRSRASNPGDWGLDLPHWWSLARYLTTMCVSFALCVEGPSLAGSSNPVHLWRWYPPEMELILRACFDNPHSLFLFPVCRNESLSYHAMTYPTTPSPRGWWPQWMRWSFL